MAIIRNHSKFLLLAVAVAVVGMSTIAIGQASNTDSGKGDKQFSLSTLYNQKYLLGDWGGQRTKLEEKGVVFDFFYVSDLLANVKGGTEKEAGWNRVRGTMDLDFGRLLHLNGLTLHVTGLWQGGVNLGGGTNPNTGQTYLGSIANPSGLVSAHTTRLDSFWLQQSLFNGKLIVRAGQFAGMIFTVCSNTAATTSWSRWTMRSGTCSPLMNPMILLRVPRRRSRLLRSSTSIIGQRSCRAITILIVMTQAGLASRPRTRVVG